MWKINTRWARLFDTLEYKQKKRESRQTDRELETEGLKIPLRYHCHPTTIIGSTITKVILTSTKKCVPSGNRKRYIPFRNAEV